MSPNNGILLNGILRPKLLNIHFDSCSFINFDFLLPHTTHIDDNVVLPLLIFETLGFRFFIFFCTLNNMPTCFIMACVEQMTLFQQIISACFLQLKQ